MDQIKFLWISKNIPNILGIEQSPDGIVTVKLRPKIEITHNFEKRNRIEIIFKDDNSKYIIPNQKALEEIYKMHINNEEIMLLLHQYCKTNFNCCE